MNLISKRVAFFGLIVLYVLYSIWVYSAGTDGPVSMNVPAQRGKKLYQELNCVSCHQLYGLGGYMGPDLTNVISQKGKDYAAAFIKNGTTKMPNFHLSDAEVDFISEYLKEVDKTGHSPNFDYEIRMNGNVIYK